MSVTVAKTAGFCFGVRRAVELAEEQAHEHGSIYAYGEIIHNIRNRAARKDGRAHRAQHRGDTGRRAGAHIRAHGVPRAVYDAFRVKNCEIFDATCPFVHKIHRIVDEESRAGRLIVILSQEGIPRSRAYAAGAARALLSTENRRRRRLRTHSTRRTGRFPWLLKQQSIGRSGIFLCLS